MPPLDADNTGSAYWRSLDELADTPRFREFVEKEFPNFAPELLAGSTSRRRFLKLMGASLALGGLTGCRWPREQIVPFANRPDNRVPGIPVQYATALEQGGFAQGLLVSSYDGRPIKIEGNERHPISGGATNTWSQAAVLELYDPDRSGLVVQRTQPDQYMNQTWDAFLAFAGPHFAALQQQGGQGLAVLAAPSHSPTLRSLRQRFAQQFPQARWVDYAPLDTGAERAGTKLAFGQALLPQYDLTQADVIVSLDSDFLVDHPAAVKLTREFASRRRPDASNHYDINRLYAIEGRLSVTGARADKRLATRPSTIPALARALYDAVKGQSATTQPSHADAIAELAEDLHAHRGKSAILAGPAQPPEVHALAHLLNAELGNVGHAVSYLPDPDGDRPAGFAQMAALTKDMAGGGVDTLVILGANPIYDAPVDLAFGAALAQVATTIHLGRYRDETGTACQWHLPQAHPLESWGDARATDGTVSIVQPLIAPLYDGKTTVEIVAALLGEQLSAYDLVQAHFAEQYGGIAGAGERWKQALHDGLVADSAWKPVQVAAQAAPAVTAAVSAGYEISFTPAYGVYDGRFANNGWLQELPDPITKLTWDNAALINPVDARKLGVERGDQIKVEVGGKSLVLPVFVLPGQVAGAISVALGYGRNRVAGRVAADQGFNTYALRTSKSPWLATGVKVSKTSGKYQLATTQDHHYMHTKVGEVETQARADRLVREDTIGYYQHHPEFAHRIVHLPQVKPLWQEGTDFQADNQWAMAIDLSKCTGCSTCVVACQAENNIPVVGKEEIDRGREMHWIRVDRYFKGDPDDPEGVAFQPVTCHHCENAPCEQVCPVGATMHDEEGLNAMAYNRCIGTRYCSNNCPFKVRRFNWFYNHHGPKHPRHDQPLTPVEQMLYNPEVTVRSRGVMEKCTFCVQRIASTRIERRNAGETIQDGDVTPACAQACPAEAIVFGDISDPNSRVSQLAKHQRSYTILGELDVRPRLNYLARITNPPGQTHGDHGHGDQGKQDGHH